MAVISNTELAGQIIGADAETATRLLKLATGDRHSLRQ